MSDMARGLVDEYQLIPAAPTVEEYLELRERSGLTPRTLEQAAVGLQGSWVVCHIVYEPTGRAVAMGRVLGDGGWYFHVVDLAVLPEHQRRGLGDAVLTALLHHVQTHAPRVPTSASSLIHRGGDFTRAMDSPPRPHTPLVWLCGGLERHRGEARA